MTTITEDYCDFETAKLLKEKGFDGVTSTFIRIDWWPNRNIHIVNYTENWNNQPEIFVSVPTLQMAMKWLREVHDLIIYVKLVNDGDLYHDAWGFVIYKKFTEENIKSDKLWFKYEEACEAAIKYCLENLI